MSVGGKSHFLFYFALLLATGGFYLANQFGQTGQLNQAGYVQLAPPQPGLQAFRDPVTGRFTRPTPEQIAELARIRQQRHNPASRVVKSRLPDGTQVIDLHSQYRSRHR